MPYKLNVPEQSVIGSKRYKSASGRTECVEFVRQTSSAPQTATWRKGLRVLDASPGSIQRGTVIATFDESGHYPTDHLGKHAAIYLSHDSQKITVLDQFADQGEVRERPIWFHRPSTTRRSNNGDTFYVVE